MEGMLEVYKENLKAAEEWEKKFNIFLTERDITEKEFEYIVYRIITDNIEKNIERAKRGNIY